MKEAIRAAGGVPFEIRTAAPSDFITGAGARGAYMLAARDLVTNDIEVAVEGAQLDGMVCLTSCDKTVPGQLMAAARLNIPTLLVPCGYQPSGEYRGRTWTSRRCSSARCTRSPATCRWKSSWA
jgi:dihydroxy-acid dehydratase